jgi:hypothetical protein
MTATPSKVVWGSGRPPRFVTSTLIAGTTSLVSEFGQKVRDDFARTYSITIVGAVLFDLLLKTDGEQFTANELVQHVETVIIEDLKLAREKLPEFQYPPFPEILLHLYQIFLDQVWPSIADNPTRKMTARLARINYETLEINFQRLESGDGS